ncbi:MAG: hypothetical protein JW841_13160 [Deltaproteobacteria bacterium]|nr:hypothetical protein [Deltaproteobacteria bacterium]
MPQMHKYSLHTPQGIIGPVKLDTVRDLVEAGILQADTLVSRDGAPLINLSAIPEFISFLRLPALKDINPNYSGDISISSFMRMLLRLHNNTSTGVMIVRDATRRKDVFLESGTPVFVTSTIGKERLGEFLIARNELEPEQVRLALTSSQEYGEPLGVAIVRLGYLSKAAVQFALREQQFYRLIDLCGWEHGNYSFYEDVYYKGEKLDLELCMPELAVRAARQISERIILKRLTDILPMIVVGFNAKVLEFCSKYLNSDERVALSVFGGERSAVQVLIDESNSAARRRAVLTVLYLLEELGGLHLRSAVDKTKVSDKPNSD